MKKIFITFIFTLIMVNQFNFVYSDDEILYKDFPNFKVEEDYSGLNLSNSVFYDINSEFEVYKEPKWRDYSTIDKYMTIGKEAVEKGFLQEEQWYQIRDMINSYENKLLIDLNYRTLQGDIDEEEYNKYVEDFGRNLSESLVNENGEKIYLCYTKEHLKAVLDLSIYNILEKDDPVLNLREFARKSDAVRLLVKVFGLEEEAIKSNYTSPYENVPKSAEPYIGMAYRRGWLGNVKDGTEWDENDITSGLFGLMFGIATGYDFESNVFYNDTTPYEINVYRRVGVYRDTFKSRNRLEIGESLRNGDLISMVRQILSRKFMESSFSIIKNLIDNDIVSYDIVNFMDKQEYFLTYENKEPLIENIIYQYGRKFMNVGSSTKYLNPLSYSTDKNQDREIGKLYIHGEYCGNSAMKSVALAVLKDLGVNENLAKKVINKEMKNGVSVKENTIIKLDDNLEVEVGCNDGYYSENQGKRVFQFIYLIFMHEE